MPGFDVPQIGGYQIQNPPENMNMSYEVVQQLNELADGGIRQRILGYRFKATLEWETNWVRQQDLTGLIAVANDTTGSSGTGFGALTFLPRPTTFPTRSYQVLWINKFDFSHRDGRFGFYRGTIELQSPFVTATVGELP